MLVVLIACLFERWLLQLCVLFASLVVRFNVLVYLHTCESVMCACVLVRIGLLVCACIIPMFAPALPFVLVHVPSGAGARARLCVGALR